MSSTSSWDSNTDVVVVTSHFKEDLTWLQKCPYPVVVCTKQGGDTPSIPADPLCVVPNLGKEATSYIKFIVTYYDHLPKSVAFIHGHDKAWHQHLDMFKAMATARIDEHNYVSLNNHFINDRNETNYHMMRIAETWTVDFQPYIARECPTRLLHDCCAQFMVSRAAITRISKEGWQHWLDMLIENPTLDIATRFEYLWHYIFGQPAIIPNVQTYTRDYFNCYHC